MIAAEGSGLICGRNPADCHGVSTESGSDRVKADSNNRDCQDYYPVATALGTDLILKLGHCFLPRSLNRDRISSIIARTKSGQRNWSTWGRSSAGRAHDWQS